MAMQNIHPGKNEPSTLMDGAPRQPVSKIRLVPAAVRHSILPLNQWPTAARILSGLIKFMAQISVSKSSFQQLRPEVAGSEGQRGGGFQHGRPRVELCVACLA